MGSIENDPLISNENEYIQITMPTIEKFHNKSNSLYQECNSNEASSENIGLRIQKIEKKILFKKETYEKLKKETESFTSNFLQDKFFNNELFISNILYFSLNRSNELMIRTQIEALEQKIEFLNNQIKIKMNFFIKLKIFI